MLARIAVVIFAFACSSETGFDAPIPPAAVGNPRPVAPVIQVDQVLQVVIPQTDVLFVLDNSTSMEPVRSALSDAFPGFVAPFVDSGVDFHIGVITTDMDDKSHRGRLREVGGLRWLDASTEDLEVRFERMATLATLGTGGSEKGLEAIWYALERENDDDEGYNAGFLRSDPTAWLHVTVFSDEDDDSDHTLIGPDIFVQWLAWLKPLPTRVSFNSVVALKDIQGSVTRRGEAYLDITERVGGFTASIFEKDWDGLMDQLGGLQTPPPADEFFLSRLPVPETIEVRGEQPDGITRVYDVGEELIYDDTRNSVRFVDGPPALGTVLTITYEVRAALAGSLF